MSKKTRVATWSALRDRVPAHARVADTDLVIVRFDDTVSVLYGRCTHRGALLAEGRIEGEDLVCAHHGWDYRYRTGLSAVDPCEKLERFEAEIDVEADAVWVDGAAVASWAQDNPSVFDDDELVI